MQWIQDFYSAYDDHDLETMMSMFADDAVMSVVGNPPVSGHRPIRQFYLAFFDHLEVVRHRILNVWYVDDATAVTEFTATGKRAGGDSFTLPGVSIAHQAKGKISELRTYCDPNPPGLPQELVPMA